jgi:uncharacterized protein
MIQRQVLESIKKNLFKQKIIMLIGPRQVGKTTLLKQLVTETKKRTMWLNADEADIRTKFENATTSTALLGIVGRAELIVIDEAHQIPDIGIKLKLMIDNFKHLQIIATGSSAFDLLQQSQEPLTGRKFTYHLYPLSFQELCNDSSLLEQKRLLETRLIYGSYPEVINNAGAEIDVLKEISNAYLYKDILKIDGLKKASIMDKLLQAIALQIGSEVSFHELAKTIGNIDPTTVEKYLDILEKAFVIFKLPALSRNLRNEIKKGKKFYFFDTGIRNAVINNFNQLALRQDKGALWENFLVAERHKRNTYQKHHCNTYFWRTTDQAEIDFVEEYGGKLHLYEFKWQVKKRTMPASITGAYDIGSTNFIDTDNVEDFLLDS